MTHPTEQQKRARLLYWQGRLNASAAGRDSRDPHFIYLAQRMRDMWRDQLEQTEMGEAA